MSMLSSQIDSLRLMARLVREHDYSEISRMLREAADTIESLREKARELGRERDQLAQAVGYWQRMYEEQIGVRR